MILRCSRHEHHLVKDKANFKTSFYTPNYYKFHFSFNKSLKSVRFLKRKAENYSSFVILG